MNAKQWLDNEKNKSANFEEATEFAFEHIDAYFEGYANAGNFKTGFVNWVADAGNSIVIDTLRAFGRFGDPVEEGSDKTFGDALAHDLSYGMKACGAPLVGTYAAKAWLATRSGELVEALEDYADSVMSAYASQHGF